MKMGKDDWVALLVSIILAILLPWWVFLLSRFFRYSSSGCSAGSSAGSEGRKRVCSRQPGARLSWQAWGQKR